MAMLGVREDSMFSSMQRLWWSISKRWFSTTNLPKDFVISKDWWAKVCLFYLLNYWIRMLRMRITVLKARLFRHGWVHFESKNLFRSCQISNRDGSCHVAHFMRHSPLSNKRPIYKAQTITLSAHLY
jgi:hypothetical protein